MIGWLGFVVHWSAVFSANVSTYCAGSAGFWFCILSVCPFVLTMVGQSQASFRLMFYPLKFGLNTGAGCGSGWSDTVTVSPCTRSVWCACRVIAIIDS